MSGVIDAKGVQWERCNQCAGWVKIEKLYYEEPSRQFTCGRDLCVLCAFTHAQANIRKPNFVWIIKPTQAKGAS